MEEKDAKVLCPLLMLSEGVGEKEQEEEEVEKCINYAQDVYGANAFPWPLMYIAVLALVCSISLASSSYPYIPVSHDWIYQAM